MEDDSLKLTFYSYHGVEKEFDEFLDTYCAQMIVKSANKPNVNPKPQNERVCRFCGNSMNETSFKKVAHLIPEFLGNHCLVSDFECDQCNVKFGDFETNFANWIGVFRTVTGTKGKKNNVPKFITAQETVMAIWNREQEFVDITSTNGIESNFDNGKLVLKYTRPGYIPIKVYKSFLKIALSTIEEKDVVQYQRAFKFISGNDDDKLFKEFAKVICHKLPWQHRTLNPIGLLFKKRDPNVEIPCHFFNLYFLNFIYCFPLPFNEIDIKVGCYNSLSVISPPPLLFTPPDPQSTFHGTVENLSSDSKTKQEETLTVNILPEELLKIMAEAGNPSDAKITQIRFKLNS